MSIDDFIENILFCPFICIYIYIYYIYLSQNSWMGCLMGSKESRVGSFKLAFLLNFVCFFSFFTRFVKHLNFFSCMKYHTFISLVSIASAIFFSDTKLQYRSGLKNSMDFVQTSFYTFPSSFNLLFALFQQ